MCKALVRKMSAVTRRDVLRSQAPGTATMSSIWNTSPGEAVGGVVSVLFTVDRRLFFEHDDGTIRIASEWERDEVFLQLLSWRDSVPAAMW